MKSTNSLTDLRRRGTITEVQLRAGLEFREDFERLEAALRRAVRVWRPARTELRQRMLAGDLDPEGAAWLLGGVAPLRLGRLAEAADAEGGVALDLVAPGQRALDARAPFTDRAAAIEAALAEAWGVAVPVALAIAPRAEEAAAQAALEALLIEDGETAGDTAGDTVRGTAGRCGRDRASG